MPSVDIARTPEQQEELRNEVARRAGATANRIPRDRPPEVGAGWQPDFSLETSLGTHDLTEIGDKWTGFNENDGISGLYFPADGVMVVDPRSSTHHNVQWKLLYDDRGIPLEKLSPVVPWVQDFYPKYDDGEYIGTGGELDYPRTAGGLYQALSRRDQLDDVLQPRGTSFGLDSLWPVAYTCALLDVPGEVTVRWSHADPRFDSEVVKREFPLSMAYKELAFAGDRPQPITSREIDILPDT